MRKWRASFLRIPAMLTAMLTGSTWSGFIALEVRNDVNLAVAFHVPLSSFYDIFRTLDQPLSTDPHPFVCFCHLSIRSDPVPL